MFFRRILHHLFAGVCFRSSAVRHSPLFTMALQPKYSRNIIQQFFTIIHRIIRERNHRKRFFNFFTIFFVVKLWLFVFFLSWLFFFFFFFSTLYATSYIYFSLINSRTVSFALVIHSKSKERLKSPSVCAAVSSPQPRENLHSDERFTAQLSIR